MSLTVHQSEGFPPIPGDTYQGICYQVIDIGTHHSDLYDKNIRQIILTWELPECRIDIEKDSQKLNLPRAISKTYTASLSEKARLYADLVSWRGAEFTQAELDGFDLKKILGKNCILTIVNQASQTQRNKQVAKVAAVAKLMSGMKVRQPENQAISFDMDADGITNIPEGLPDWIVEQIKSSIEYKAVIHAQNHPALKEAQEAAGMEDETPGDDIPF